MLQMKILNMSLNQWRPTLKVAKKAGPLKQPRKPAEKGSEERKVGLAINGKLKEPQVLLIKIQRESRFLKRDSKFLYANVLINAMKRLAKLRVKLFLKSIMIWLISICRRLTFLCRLRLSEKLAFTQKIQRVAANLPDFTICPMKMV